MEIIRPDSRLGDKPGIDVSLRTCLRSLRAAGSCGRTERRNRSLHEVNEDFEHRQSADVGGVVDLEQVLTTPVVMMAPLSPFFPILFSQMNRAMLFRSAISFTLLVLLSLNTFAEEQMRLEYKIKAGYLYNFSRFISWPADQSETFNLCIVGTDPFGTVIDAIQSRKAAGRPIQLFRFAQMDAGRQCHILYLGATQGPDIAAKGITEGVLTVSDRADFVKRGGMIGFVLKNGKIRLQINLHQLKQSGLNISAKLIEVAEIVEGEIHD